VSPLLQVPPPQQQQQQQPDQDEIEDEEDVSTRSCWGLSSGWQLAILLTLRRSSLCLLSQTTPFQIPDPAPIPTEPVPHANTEQTTLIWNLCHKGDLQQLAAWIFREPGVVHLRSEDGRGALWWANEFAHFDMIDFLIERGADPEATDDAGNSPAELLPASAKRPRNVQKVNTEQAAQMAKQQIQQQRKFMQQQQRQQQQAPN
jgi:hypothetical protein